ncbi:hypothetical protein Aduo_005863 [Ancylostoma duodenale]
MGTRTTTAPHSCPALQPAPLTQLIRLLFFGSISSPGIVQLHWLSPHHILGLPSNLCTADGLLMASGLGQRFLPASSRESEAARIQSFGCAFWSGREFRRGGPSALSQKRQREMPPPTKRLNQYELAYIQIRAIHNDQYADFGTLSITVDGRLRKLWEDLGVLSMSQSGILGLHGAEPVSPVGNSASF